MIITLQTHQYSMGMHVSWTATFVSVIHKVTELG